MRFCSVADGGRAFCGFSNGWKKFPSVFQRLEKWASAFRGAFRAGGRPNSRFNAKNAEGLTQRNAKNSRETGGRRAGGADTRRPRNLGDTVSRLGGDASPHQQGRTKRETATCGAIENRTSQKEWRGQATRDKRHAGESWAWQKRDSGRRQSDETTKRRTKGATNQGLTKRRGDGGYSGWVRPMEAAMRMGRRRSSMERKPAASSRSTGKALSSSRTFRNRRAASAGFFRMP